jgi:RNA polymerase sigma-70 factor, ECF subfamily
MTLSEPSELDDALLDRLRRGDEAALAEVFGAHRERLWRMVRFRIDRRLAARVDADDILQEAFLNAAQRISFYLQDTSKSLFVWLRMIVSQTLVDVHRRHAGTAKRGVAREVSLDGGAGSFSTSGALAEQLAGSITSAAARGEVRERLEAALAVIDPIDQEIIALRHFEDLTNVEAAEVLGLRPTAASNRYVRAIARLKEVLDQMGWGIHED